MKRKILSYLLVWLLTLFIWWCFTYVEATWGGNSTQEEVLWAGWWSSDWWWDWSVNLSEGNGVNPDWWRTATTPPPSGILVHRLNLHVQIDVAESNLTQIFQLFETV